MSRYSNTAALQTSRKDGPVEDRAPRIVARVDVGLIVVVGAYLAARATFPNAGLTLILALATAALSLLSGPVLTILVVKTLEARSWRYAENSVLAIMAAIVAAAASFAAISYFSMQVLEPLWRR